MLEHKRGRKDPQKNSDILAGISIASDTLFFYAIDIKKQHCLAITPESAVVLEGGPYGLLKPYRGSQCP